MSKKIVLIDGFSILNRAFYGIHAGMTNFEGLHTNAVYGFLNIMLKLFDDEKPEYAAVAFDVKAPTFRHEMYAEYKGTRKGMPEELLEQVPLIKEVLKAMTIPTVELAGYEADDILGTLSKRLEGDGYEVILLSGDRDMLQLAGEHTTIRIPTTKGGQTTVQDYKAADVLSEKGVTPDEFVHVKALMGDTSDNIPGVPGIGEKTAYSLIKEYHSIEAVLANAASVKPPRAQKALLAGGEMAELSYKLAKIDRDAPVGFTAEDAKIGNPFTKEAYEVIKRLEIKSILKRFESVQVAENKVEDSFCMINDFGQAEEAFAAFMKEAVLGLQLICDRKEIYGLAVSNGKDQTVTIPAEGFLTGSYLADKAKMLCERGKETWVMNLKEMLPHTGLCETEGLFDAGVAGYLLNPLKSAYVCDDLAAEYLGITVPSITDLLGKTKLADAFGQKPEESRKAFGYMAYIAAAAGKPLMDKLEEQGMKALFTEIEMPVIYSLYHMESEGIRVQKEELSEYGEKLRISIEILEKEIYELAGETFNINSPKQLGVILFEKMHMPFGKKTKTGYSTSADILEKLAPEYPVVSKILNYRQLTKLKSTYADGLAGYIGPDGRIHGTFNQTITATGRISSTEPNLQNIPVRMELGREIRKVFIPKEGCIFLDADYSQIELRVLAHMSGDENLIRAYHMAQDIHAITASQVFHVPFEEVTPLQRRNAKAVNFGIVYGISAFGLSEDLSITRNEANEYIKRYFETYPMVKSFLDKLVEDGKTMGYVTTIYGRRRPIPELTSSNFMQRSFGERVAMNSPIQGTAADIMKLAMIGVDRRLRKEGLKSRLILQIHDELLIETYIEEKDQVERILREEMDGAARLSVPLEVSLSEGASWFETK